MRADVIEQTMGLILFGLAFIPGSRCIAEVLGRPNIVVMMVDDLGYSDIGCYGSEIDTPNLDALAAGGVRFSQFYNTAKCHSSRVSLLTGQYCIAAGDTALSHGVTSAEVLGNAGYFTAMTGKWHLNQQPTDFGFQRFFGHLSGACNYFSGDGTFRLNGNPWKVPGAGFYTTVANVDYGLEFLREARKTRKPWYLYVAFNAPHAPLHALPQDYAKYKGKYDQGWDSIRDRRIEKQFASGILPKTLRPSPRPEHIPAWDDLEQWKRDYEANRMTTLAAMIDRVDQEVGRLVDDLRMNGELENTLILFVSDNGACPYDRRPAKLNTEPTNAQNSLGDSTGWAWARNSPFRYYKQNQFEGGVSTPAIFHWPTGIRLPAGTIVEQPAHLIDVLPTLADISGSEIPTRHSDRELRPVSGVSLKPLLQGNSLGDRPPIHLLFGKDRGLRSGDWKLVSFKGAKWELYNLADDRAELNDLASEEPERLKELITLWHEIAENTLHLPFRMRAPVRETKVPHRNSEWTNFGAKEPSLYYGNKRASKNELGATKTNSLKVRERKNTKLIMSGDELQLEFTGTDPGIAMDLRNAGLLAGPYRLVFRVKLASEAKPAGEVFFTTDSQSSLPKGERIQFAIKSNGQWADVSMPISDGAHRIHQLRIDVCEGPGSATIADLRLLSNDGQTLLKWAEKGKRNK